MVLSGLMACACAQPEPTNTATPAATATTGSASRVAADKPFAPGGRITLQLAAGSYEVRGAADGHIRVTLSGNVGDTKVEVTAADGRAEVVVKDTPQKNFRALIEVPHASDLVTRLTAGELTLAAIEGLGGQEVVLHAAGVSDGRGQVLALIGAPGAGKTTAAVALCQAGFGYVTDEAVAVDDEGSVRLFARPLAIAEDGPESPKVQVSPDDLGLRRCAPALTLAGIVVLDRRSDALGAPTLEPCGGIDALLSLIPQASSLPAFEHPLGELSSMVEGTVGVHVLRYDEILDAAHLLADLLDGAASPLETDLQPATQAGDLAWGLMDDRVRRAPFVDAVLSEDEALLLIGDVPVRVSGIGLTIWDALDRPLRIDELTTQVTDVHGPHPEARRLVEDAVSSLTEAKVLGFARPERIGAFRAARHREHVHAVDHDGCCGPGATLST